MKRILVFSVIALLMVHVTTAYAAPRFDSGDENEATEVIEAQEGLDASADQNNDQVEVNEAEESPDEVEQEDAEVETDDQQETEVENETSDQQESQDQNEGSDHQDNQDQQDNSGQHDSGVSGEAESGD